MSVKLMAMVWDAEMPSGPCKLVLLKMADHANDEGLHIYPSVPTLAKKCSISERSVRYELKKLRELGLIEQVGHHKVASGATNEYRICVEKLLDLNTPEEALQDLQPCKPCSPSPANLATQGLQGLQPNHQKNHQKNHQRAKVVEILMLGKVSEEVAVDFEAHRSSRKGGALTVRAAEMIVKELAKHPGANPDEVLKQSIMNGWTGVFPERLAKKQQYRNGQTDDPISQLNRMGL